MKKLILVLIITITASFTSFAQQEKNIESLTTGKWNIEVVEVDNEVMNVKNEGHWMVFHPNGSYQIVLDNEEQRGTWNLDKELGINFDNEVKNGTSSIKKINDKELKFSISGYTIALTKEVI